VIKRAIVKNEPAAGSFRKIGRIGLVVEVFVSGYLNAGGIASRHGTLHLELRHAEQKRRDFCFYALERTHKMDVRPIALVFSHARNVPASL